ncbi:hypothetical protein TREMEDRAFT_28047 [Tremella mesenterica DSM 1558]|uniref:uncharacterized protein n=1 Tax=Tremella mesenterica (strain ATCC 24925 / CBS 8224 / DSM 1558 / NBRC 9311 / NRRL Y-6157 / RJB 2259-6 / UBC 559-6) TaxID=578456 RepID=UPI0003F49D80|nr:uncharacterized protein TREMEDRAFT_28047 [Tremella mesenterica DSM 1558]EIW71228.1 hypothetical protein TREMEDRAFT_28047 [Tremella mesenterica DSM 1558]
MAEASSSNVSSYPCHLEGITRVCFSPDGSTIFTGGADCLVRIHRADDPDAEPGFHDDHTDAVTSLSCSNSYLVTGSVDNIARYFSYPQNEFQGYITRSSGVAIRWVAMDKAGERVAVCSDDLLVKIVHVKDTTRVQLLSDNTKPVRSATWDPSGQYLTAVSCDGKLRIYDTVLSTPACIKIVDNVISSSEPDSAVSAYAAWHPSGAYFAIPLRTHDIGVISKNGWSKQPAFSSSDGHKTPISELAWSPNGRYLASSAGEQILVWAEESRQVVARYTNPVGAISGLAFSPKTNLIVFTSLDGTFHRWNEPIPSNFPSPVVTEAAHAKKVDRLLDDDFGDDMDDLEDKGEDLGDDLVDDWIVDDDETYAKEEDEKWGKGRTEVVNVTKAQAAFTPGSTVMKNKKRYLGFNMIGVVDATDLETHHVVNVEFHDKSSRRGYHFQDHHKYSMASIGEQGVIYACPADGDQPSQIYYRPYDSWASQGDWSMGLPLGEEAVCVAAGGPAGSLGQESMGSIIVATSRGFVRFMSSSGIQRYMWRLGEDVVSMVAGKDSVIVIHREGGTSLDGCQNLRYTLMDLNNFEIIQEGRVPLPKKTTLTWIGFTSNDAPTMFDSTGLLSVLDRFRRPGQARWVPLLDTTLLRKEGRKESYWPVGVSATHMSCVILKGNEKEPWFPRPLIQEIELQMPLLGMDNQQGRLEERLLTSSIIRGEVHLSLLRDAVEETPDGEIEYDIKTRSVALDKELLQLVQGACKADNLQRALDLSRLMYLPGTIDAAAKVAAFYHLPGLQERIQSVRLEKERKRTGVKRTRKSLIPPSEHHVSPNNGMVNGKFSEFVPRATSRRTFGGVNRDSTPAQMRGDSYVPETPGQMEDTPQPVPPPTMSLDMDMGSPGEKRKRKVGMEEDEFTAPAKKVEELSFSSEAPKNPFAKKTHGNPFAKAATARPLDAIKSTSFFDRVDDIEASGMTKAKPKKAKENVKPHGQGKQTTLFNTGMEKRPALPHKTSSTESESLMSDTPRLPLPTTLTAGVLEESQLQDTLTDETPSESIDID